MTDLSQLSDSEILALYRSMKPQQSGGAKDSALGGFVRGLRDPIDAGAQMLVHALPDSVVAAGDALGNKLADWGLPVTRTNHAGGTTVDDMARRAELDYRQNWRQGNDTGLDAGRIAGNIAATLPVSRLLPFGAATLPGRIAQGAGAGATLGTLQPVDTSEPDSSFLAQKAMQAAMGGALGGAAAPIGGLLGSLLGKGVEKGSQALDALKNRANLTLNANVTIDNAFREAGVDLTSLPAGIRTSLAGDVSQALKAGEKIDPAAMSRMVAARTVGVNLTKGQATRNPAQFQFEQNTRGIVGAGEPLQRRFAEQNAQLVSQAGQGASPLNQYQGGQRLIDALQTVDNKASANVTGAYTTARGMVGANADAPLQPLAQAVGNTIETYGTENIPGVVLRKLQSYGVIEGGKQTKIFTVGEADSLRKVINANFDPANKTQAAALRAIRSGIDDAENLMADKGSQIGEQAAQAFAKARDLARNRFSTLEKVDALKAAVEGAEPDKFVTKHLINAPVGQVRELKAILQATGDSGLVDEMRGQVLSHLKQRAVNGADDEFAKFSQSAFRKALGEIGPEKLRILFQPEELARLRALERTASTIQSQPAGAAVNNSSTAAAAMNLFSRIPYANAVVRPLQSAVTSARATASLEPTLGVKPQPSPELIRRLTQRGGMLGATAGGLLGADFGAF